MNALGAAFILPIYCFRHLRSNSLKRDSGLNGPEAKALPITIAISATFPLILMLPPILNAVTETQQGYIALFQLTPLLFAAVQLLGSLVINSFGPAERNTIVEKKYLKGSYIFAGIIAASAHLFVLGVSLCSSNKSVSFGTVFLPWYTHVDQSTPEGLVMGAHLFTQFDSFIIAITCAVYTYALLEPLMKKEQHIKLYNQTSSFRAAPVAGLLIAASTFALGPAATVSLAFAAREDSVREDFVQKTR